MVIIPLDNWVCYRILAGTGPEKDVCWLFVWSGVRLECRKVDRFDRRKVDRFDRRKVDRLERRKVTRTDT